MGLMTAPHFTADPMAGRAQRQLAVLAQWIAAGLALSRAGRRSGPGLGGGWTAAGAILQALRLALLLSARLASRASLAVEPVAAPTANPAPALVEDIAAFPGFRAQAMHFIDAAGRAHPMDGIAGLIAQTVGQTLRRTLSQTLGQTLGLGPGRPAPIAASADPRALKANLRARGRVRRRPPPPCRAVWPPGAQPAG